MIWLAVRRRRTVLLGFLGVVVLLDAWMLANGHSSDAALRHPGTCPTIPCQQPSGLLAPARQAVVIDLLLLALPCLLGLVLGVSLVAGETDHATHRLVWTQGVSRTRWYATSLLVMVLAAVLLMAIQVPVAHWWAGTAWVDLPNQITLGGDRIQPDVFGVSGVVPIAYSLFALALGAAAGAVLRRVSWAAVATVVLYAGLAVVMVTSVRASFAPTGFFLDGTTDSAQYVNWPSPPPWVVTYRYRYVPGQAIPPHAEAPDRVAAGCQDYRVHPQSIHPDWVVTCMRQQGVEGGFVVQPPRHYWVLQWSETVLYLGCAVVLTGIGLLAVRRTQD